MKSSVGLKEMRKAVKAVKDQRAKAEPPPPPESIPLPVILPPKPVQELLAASGEAEKVKKRGRPTNEERAAREAAKRLEELVERGEEIILPPTIENTYPRGFRVQTAPKCVVGGLVFKGKVIYHPSDSAFVRILWDDGSCQCHHMDAIVPCKDKKKSRRSRKLEDIIQEELEQDNNNNNEEASS